MLWIGFHRVRLPGPHCERTYAPFKEVCCCPFGKLTPAWTKATRWGALILRQCFSAPSSSLKAIASPALRDPAPLVRLVRALTVENVDSIGFVDRR